jgi:alpha-galactosidase
MSTLIAEYQLGIIVAQYLQPAGSKRCELYLVPLERRGAVLSPRRYLGEERPEIRGLPEKFKPVAADGPNSLVQVKLQQDDAGSGFAAGMTLVESQTMTGLEYVGQRVFRKDNCTLIETTLRDAGDRFRCIHRLRYSGGELGVRCSVEFVNESSTTLSLELLTSFAINGLTPFVADNATPHLEFHRFRSWWSLEGRLDSQSVESLHLERSWGGFGLFSERFGQVGTMPARHWFPCAAIEDKTAGVVWAVQVAWAGSWQMELIRRGDRLTLCGGLADREFGHWLKHLAPGESITTPEACMTVVAGSLDQACQMLTSLQRRSAENAPTVERDLPVCFNEWCTSWGNPDQENILAAARRLEGTGIRYIVIDDGWAIRPPEALAQSNGDWIVDQRKFPGGLKPTCDALRGMGYIPGIWFEFEVINPGAKAWNETGHMLWRDGRPLQVGFRRFWDFTDPWVEDYLTEKVINLIRENGIGYLKVDYNDNLGLGCDHSDSFGEGLRKHVEGVQNFFRKIRSELPDLVIENCSSGGHRLEPSMQAITSMGSFSDAHEAAIIPLVARNLQRLILPRQSLIWAVLHAYDSKARLIYSLAAGFLGRLCLSGDIHNLSDDQMAVVRGALSMYRSASAVIDHGTSRFHGTPDKSYVDPIGWQAVVRSTDHQVLVVIHAFNLPEEITLRIPLPAGNWRTISVLKEDHLTVQISSDEMEFSVPPGCHGVVWLAGCGTP